MKKLLRAALPFVLCLSGAAWALEIEVGGRTIDIPVPPGYAELTPEMSPTYEAMWAYVAPTNERYAMFIPADAAEALLRGEGAEFERHLMIEGERQAVKLDITQADFDELRSTMRGEIVRMYESMQPTLPEVFDDASDSMSEVFDADVAMSAAELVPMEPHLDTEDALAFSQIINIDIALDGEDIGTERGIATVALVHVSNKIVFISAYGGENDLEWTRVFTTNWAEQIVAANEGTEELPQSVTRVGTVGEVAYEQVPEDDESPLPLLPIIAIAIGILGLIVVLRAAGRRRKG